MKITMNETVATVTNCYLNGKTYDVPDAEGNPLVRAGQATSDDPAAAEANKQRRATLDKRPSVPMERPGAPLVPAGPVPDLHPAEQPDQTPADIERAGHTRGPVENAEKDKQKDATKAPEMKVADKIDTIERRFNAGWDRATAVTEAAQQRQLKYAMDTAANTALTAKNTDKIAKQRDQVTSVGGA